MNAGIQPRVLGRYLFYAPIASGGMATVYLGRMAGPKGFSRIVAIKQLHSQLVHDTDFVTMFLDEAQLIGRIHHSNVVAPIDVLEADGDLCIVMEYVHGEAVGRLMRLSRPDRMPLRIVAAIMIQTLLGLHAAHEVTDLDGKPLAIVHRDVSPQNILVGEDGIARVVDFGIAKAAHHANAAEIGKLKGKLGYMAPEQLFFREIDRRCDIFGAGIILWEMLTGKKLFAPEGPAEAAERMLKLEARPPSSIVPTLTPELDAIALRALSVDPNARFPDAHEMARALELACPPAGAIEVAAWMKQLVGDTLRTRAEWIADLSSMDLGEWTQTYVMSSSLPLVVSAAPAVPDCPSNIENSGPQLERLTSVPANQCPTERRIVPTSPSPTEPRPANGTSSSKLPAYVRRPAFLIALAALSVVVIALAWWRHSNAALARPGQYTYAASASNEVESTTPLPSTSLPVTVASGASLGGEDAGSISPSPDGSSTAGTHPPSPANAAESVPASQPSRAAASVEQPSNTATKRSNASAQCRTPYYFDAQHIKRFRPECFKRH